VGSAGVYGATTKEDTQAMKESSLLREIQLAFTNLGARLFRNNTALGWAGRATQYYKQQTVKVGPGDVLVRSAHPLKAGLCVGSSDLIGWTTIVISEDMVGRPVAVFTAIEGKTGRLQATEEQVKFIQAVNMAGGYAGVARSSGDAVEIIKGWPGEDI